MGSGGSEPTRQRGDSAGAERAYRWALVLADRLLAPDASLTAWVRNDLAVALKYTGGFDEAAALYRRSLEVLSARLGRDHPEVATVLHNIGGLAHAAGRPADREWAGREALRIRQQALGSDQPAVAADGAALAGILIALGRDEEAKLLLERALQIFERCFGPADYEVGVTLGNLGAIEGLRYLTEYADAA